MSMVAIPRFVMSIKRAPMVKSRVLMKVRPGTEFRVLAQFSQGDDTWVMLDTPEGPGYVREFSNGVRQVILRADESSEDTDDTGRAAQVVE